LTVDVSGFNVTVTSSNLNTIKTNGDMHLATFTDATNVSLSWTEDDDSGETIVTAVKYDSGDDEALELQTPSGATFAYGPLDFSEDNDDDNLFVTQFGTKVEYDSDGKDTLVIYHPDDDVKADVFVAPTGAALNAGSATEEGCQVSEKLNPISSSVNKFDTDVTSATAQNVVSVGGPCANAVTSALLGNPEVCYEGFEAGKAMLKLVENGENVALVVAGGTGEDTWRASKILQNYDQYTLSGMEMVATTVSESGLSVMPVAMAEESTE